VGQNFEGYSLLFGVLGGLWGGSLAFSPARLHQSNNQSSGGVVFPQMQTIKNNRGPRYPVGSLFSPLGAVFDVVWWVFELGFSFGGGGFLDIFGLDPNVLRNGLHGTVVVPCGFVAMGGVCAEASRRDLIVGKTTGGMRGVSFFFSVIVVRVCALGPAWVIKQLVPPCLFFQQLFGQFRFVPPHLWRLLEKFFFRVVGALLLFFTLLPKRI